ncbi:MAG TPA: DNA/RNA non-specific endonuclease [Polyangiaceae bacterium]|nr:DNA/RNA non-specific endonuclease [Polyangiaceae bacterium]
MTASRAPRAPKNSLLSTFSAVVLLLIVARLALLQCGAPLPPTSPVTPIDGAGAPASTARASSGAGSTAPRGSEASVSSSVHVALGTPRDADPSDEYFIDERAFVLSYSPEKRVPNWVAWQLAREYFGHVHRKDDFRADLALPARFYRVKASDYLHSGYDRGHMCPSADRKDSAEDNSQTFLFTNIMPQLHELNAGPWERLESYARERVQAGALLYIVAGGLFSAPFPTIGNGVAVPAATFKIIVVLAPGQGTNDVDEHTEVLAVLMPNQRGVGDHEWTEYLTTVDAIEQASGYDFLNAVPERVQRVIEARMPASNEFAPGRRPAGAAP